MSPKTAVLTDKAPKPSPFLSQAVIHNGLIYCSGNMGKDPVTGKLVGGGVEARTVSLTAATSFCSILYLVILSNLAFAGANPSKLERCSGSWRKQLEECAQGEYLLDFDEGLCRYEQGLRGRLCRRDEARKFLFLQLHCVC